MGTLCIPPFSLLFILFKAFLNDSYPFKAFLRIPILFKGFFKGFVSYPFLKAFLRVPILFKGFFKGFPSFVKGFFKGFIWKQGKGPVSLLNP